MHTAIHLYAPLTKQDTTCLNIRSFRLCLKKHTPIMSWDHPFKLQISNNILAHIGNCDAMQLNCGEFMMITDIINKP